MTRAKRFRIALSFPGEKRAFVEAVAEHLAKVVGQNRVLYDNYYEDEFARPNLDIYLQRLYHDESELIAVFLCAEYESKQWCGLEARAIRDLIKTRQDNCVMPLRFDTAEVPGFFSIDGYVWIGDRSPEEIAEVMLKRLALISTEPIHRGPPGQTDRDAHDAFQRISVSLTSQAVATSDWIARAEEQQLAGPLEARAGGVMCLLGKPGSGKTALLAKVTAHAVSLGYETIAIKADTIPHDEKFQAWAERQLNIGVSIADAVKAVASRTKVVVIVDQLDALASLVDLTSDRLNDVIDFIAQCVRLPQVSVICSCREFEFHRDTRFTSLDAQCISLELPEWEQIATELKKAGIDGAESWPPEFREILRTPQHLQMYLRRFKQTGKKDVFASYQAMLDDLWERKLTTSEQRDFVYRLAEFLVAKEALWAPAVQFEAEKAIVEQLESEEIIQRQGRQVGFRHQTLLEHAKARLFTKSERSLCDHVLDRQTAILVRPTLWAVLGYLREADPAKYREELDRLMASDLRLHIRYLLIDFLSQVREPEEFEIVHMAERLKVPDDWLRVLIAIRGKEQWFWALRDTVLPMVMSWKAHEQWPMIGLIGDAWRFAREDCLKLVESYWLNDPEKDALTWQALREIDHWDQRTVDMICQVIRRSGIDGDRLWWAEDMVYRISEDQPELAPQVFLAVTERDVTKSATEGQSRGRPSSPLDSSNTWYKLPDVAAAAPVGFLRTAWQWFVKTAVEYHSSNPSSVLNVYGGHLHSLDPERRGLDCPVTTAFVAAITETAKTDPNSFLDITRSSRSTENGPVQRILARGFAAIAVQFPEIAFEFLIEDTRRFMLGNFSDEEPSDTTALVAAIASNWSENGRQKLEAAILSWTEYRPGVELEDCQRTWDREARLRLLKAIPENLLSIEVAEFVRKEECDLPEWNRKRRRSHFGSVREIPPLTKDEMEKASDEQVLESLRGPLHHDRSMAQWKEVDGGWEEPGGAWSATSELAELAKTNRARVFSLMPQLITEGNEVPAAHVIRTLADSDLPANEAFDLIRKLAALEPKSEVFCSDAAYLLYRRCQQRLGLPDDICEILEHWLAMPWVAASSPLKSEGDDETAEKEDGNATSVLWGYHGGIFETDKSFYPMLAVTNGYLMRDPAATERWLEFVDRQLEQGTAEGTWVNYCLELRHIRLKGCDRDSGVAVIQKLFDRYPSIKLSVEGCRLMGIVSDLMPADVILALFDELLASQQFRHQQAFGELLTTIALRQDAHKWTRPILEQYLNEIEQGVAGREAVATGIAFAAAHLWDEPEARPEACKVLCRLMPYATPKIAEALGTVFRAAEDFPADGHTDELLRAIAANPKFLSGRFVTDLIEILAELLPHSRRNVLDVCKAIIGIRGDELRSISHELFVSGPHLVNIAMTLQRFSDTRSEGLSLLEDLLRLGLDDAFTILHDIDIRPAAVRRREPRSRRRRKAS